MEKQQRKRIKEAYKKKKKAAWLRETCSGLRKPGNTAGQEDKKRGNDEPRDELKRFRRTQCHRQGPAGRRKKENLGSQIRRGPVSKKGISLIPTNKRGKRTLFTMTGSFWTKEGEMLWRYQVKGGVASVGNLK